VGLVIVGVGVGVRSGLRPADPFVGEVLSGGAVAFFNSAICVSWSKLPPPPLCWA
jgi:hypothetical protein